MSRPLTKDALLELAEKKYNELMSVIDSLSLEEQKGIFPFEERDRQIRDCLAHLHEWHKLFIKWANSNMDGDFIPFLPRPYTWGNYPEMNIEFWEKHQSTSLDSAKNLLAITHGQCLELINQLSNEELFTKRYFNWTGTTNLVNYAVSATSSHYKWALKIIKKYKKALKNKQI
ncbi:ClbS/DfsB family four-helix bundle protein [Providencia rettgeri]|uniref:ClbS/DfsB family four-helix bundle protein n=1 Tax=Providencia rettgeri TaxID=587 RepID=UPI0016557F38|nr:ClbS/DfsB family four-helix bundle protein [Providencia sp. G1(2023)]EJD6083308.1 ClbS/DfsB family four-helix bundle protein [Providencia rettgeri]MBC8655055.1 ClbS/DfsB family four-helix bundle protein [Providencia vermicola]EJD6582938.1 ClbS/DfsB family four-helix bundle protein [Providencia rettgeri]EJD6598890.1 ClbS/DfsB family four-helix bundle protein [Providencia rettgeri]ELR5054697.1 ClbS/DfsB family four-helix bundle protein [Providencia rettgeri]